MTIKHILIQRGVELVILEIVMCLGVKLIIGDVFPNIGYLAILISTAFFDVLSYIVK